MPWVKRKQDEHVCLKPKHERAGENVAPGDRWKCDAVGCNRVWTVKSVWRGDLREPLGPLQRPFTFWEHTPFIDRPFYPED